MTIQFSSLDINDLSPKSDFEEKVILFVKEWFSDSLTVKVQTSGSTGTPKIYDVEKEKMLNSAEMTCNFLHLETGNTALLCLPVDYISGKMMVVRAIKRNMELIVTAPAIQPLENFQKKVDFCAMTPLQVENSLDKIHLIKNLIIGGATVSENLKDKIYKALGDKAQTTVYETYGMSETLSHIAMRKVYPIAEDVFTVLNDVEISTDSRRCLKIFAPLLNPETLTTNDVVELLNDRQFRFLGRADNVVNSGGAKIFPEKLEAMVKKGLDKEVVLLGIPDEVLGEKLILVIESETSGIPLPVFNFEKSFHKPKEIIFLNKIPRLPNGKIDRLTLKKNIVDGNL